jgi:hypothetical protein
MPAFNEQFPWRSYYDHYRYFEQVMSRHGKVRSLSTENDGVYELERAQGDTVRIFVCECYAFGVAELNETVDNIPNVNVIIINSIWCGYSPDAKKECRDRGIGLFAINEFMAALHRDNYWQYLTESEIELFQENGWLDG